MSKGTYAIALHGGAGTLLREQMTSEREAAYRKDLLAALSAGEKVLKSGGSALDAVIETVVVLEDSPLFNAGHGSVFTHEGRHELDASLMEGTQRKAGAACALRHVANPIRLCRKIMDSEFVMMNGEGAEEYAREVGMEIVSNRSFSTDFRREQLAQAQKAGRVQLDHSDNRDKYGTVGAVALDQHGQLAAATSTGGMTNKRYGRIGDSALIGSGTWADNRTCAISATGYGEFFIRNSVASRIASMMEYGGLSLERAAHIMIDEEVLESGGDGGIVAIDKEGNIIMPFNSQGMYRAWVKEGEPQYSAIFKTDALTDEMR